MLAIDKKRLNELLRNMSRDFRVYAPYLENGTGKFAPYREDRELYLEMNTLLPPKDIFFPQTEKMYRFRTAGSALEIEEIEDKKEKQVIFGIRSCDAFSIDCLDKVFLSRGYEDAFYKNKRENTLLVGLACTAAGDTCFCRSMGLNPQEAVGVDLQVLDLGEEWGFEARTAAGEGLLARYRDLLRETDAAPIPTQEFKLKVDVEGVPEKLSRMFDHPMWEEISRKCLGCALCTYLCPTCHCFDVSGKVKGEEGYRFRCWDSCMFSEYTRMAGGHNPRPTKKERVRNRFMHKLCYFVERYGQLLCTGCGRCLAKCPVNMDITAVIRKIKEAEVE